VTDGSETPSVRLAELLGVLSLGADLGLGQPMEHAMRQCVVARRMGEQLGLSAADLDVVYYVGLIAWVGCHVDAYEQAKWFGDDLVMKGDARRVDLAGMQGARTMVRLLGSGLSPLERVRVGLGFVGGGWREAAVMLENHWYAADDLAGRLGLGDDVRASLRQTFERWDGKGVPDGTKGEGVLMTARLVTPPKCSRCSIAAMASRPRSPPRMPRWKSRSHVEAIEPGIRFAYRSHRDDRNPSYARWRWDITPARDAVQITVSWDAYPKTMGRKLIGAPIRRRMLEREATASLDTIRRTLEPAPAEGH
jgi:hypothetical protein